MKEGKNLHFRDNKPLCSYSVKLCRQRRLNGYAFCIRHILEDTSAPFKQCSYVTKNNNQKCLNAIPLKIDRGYCHSHLQLAGIIPKTERKIKPSSGKNGNTNSISNSTPPTNGFKDYDVVDSQNNNNKHQDDLNSTKSIVENSQFSNQSSNNSFSNGNNYGNKHNLQNHHTAPILNGKNSHVTNGAVKINGKLNNDATDDERFPASPPTLNQLPPKNNYSKKCQQQKQLSNNSTFQSSPSSSSLITNGTSPASNNKVKEQLYNSIINNYGKKSVGEIKNGQLSTTNVSPISAHKLIPNSLTNNSISSTIPSKTTTTTASPVDRWKILSKFQSNQNQDGFNIKRKGEEFLINGSNSEDVKSVLCFMKKKNYEQWKALNILEKLPLFSEDKSGKLNQASPTPTTATLSQDIYPTRGLDIVLVPPILNGKTKSKEYLYQNDSKEPESRQEFLSRVRQAFKSHLKTIKNVVKLGEKQERGVKRCFRESLMFCVMNDPNYTAQVLLKSDPRFKPNEGGSTATAGDDEIINDKNRQIIIDTNKSKLLPCINTLNTTKSSLFTSDDDDDIEGYNYDEGDAGKNVIRLNAFVETMDNNSDVQVICERKRQDDDDSNISSIQIQQQPPKGVNLCQSLSSSENNLDTISWNTNTKFKSQVNSLDSSLTPCRKIKSNGVRTNGSTLLNSKSESTIISQQQQLNFKVNGKIKKTSNSDFGLNSNYLKKPRIENGFKDMEYPKGLSLNGQLNQHLQGTLNNIVNSAVSHNENSSTAQLLHPYSSELPNFESVLNPVSSSSTMNNNSPFNSHSNQQDCNFTDEDLEKSFELHIDDPEIATSRLLEDSGLTEDDLNDLFPASENKLGSELDFSTNFDTNDIDYSLFANIFPNFRSQPESLVTNQF